MNGKKLMMNIISWLEKMILSLIFLIILRAILMYPALIGYMNNVKNQRLILIMKQNKMKQDISLKQLIK